jgi:hypothetical protein
MKQHTVLCAAIGGAIIVALYYAMKNDGDDGQHYVPQYQSEAQFAVLNSGIGGSANIGDNTPLDTRVEVHFWSPGFNDETNFQPVPTQHRYPAVSGGNITAVMHHGWSSLTEPDCNLWFRNPPEAAVL